MPPVLKIYLIYIAVLSVITLILYGIDKIKAINGWYRIPEAVLLSSSLLGGGVGGIVGMLLFRHKTKHWYFFAVNIIAIILHASVLFFLLK
ncbi:MAG: DUF1294 domain-containing protein [Clostridia bacterium]|nr:DUF1294 domain-containing protein [Clostridia bacterium]